MANEGEVRDDGSEEATHTTFIHSGDFKGSFVPVLTRSVLPHRGSKRIGACAQESSKIEELRGYVQGVESVAVAQCRVRE